MFNIGDAERTKGHIDICPGIVGKSLS